MISSSRSCSLVQWHGGGPGWYLAKQLSLVFSDMLACRALDKTDNQAASRQHRLLDRALQALMKLTKGKTI